MFSLASCHNKNFGLLLIRIALGLVFVYHGWGKVDNMEATIGFFGSIGLAPFWAYITAWVELLGGLLLILGICVREAGALLTIVMLTAIFKVHLANGFGGNGGYEFQLVLLLASLAMVFTGAGKYALLKDKMCANCNCKDGVCTCK